MTHSAGHVDLVGILPFNRVLAEEAGPGPVAPEMFSGGVMVDGIASMWSPIIWKDQPFIQSCMSRYGSTGERSRSRSRQNPAAPDRATTARRRRSRIPRVSPWSPRPPGAAGPGRRVSGWSGPGLPGPGRPAEPSMVRRECPDRSSGDQFRLDPSGSGP